jgi:hypothetical protein
MIDLEKLAEYAEKAIGKVNRECCDGLYRDFPDYEAIERLNLAANPQTILKLIRVVKAAKEYWNQYANATTIEEIESAENELDAALRELK